MRRYLRKYFFDQVLRARIATKQQNNSTQRNKADCLVLQDSFIQGHNSSKTGADEYGEVATQQALVDGGDGEVVVDSTQIEVLSVHKVGQQPLGEVEDEGVKLQLGVGLNGSPARGVRVAWVCLQRKVDEVRHDCRQDEGMARDSQHPPFECRFQKTALTSYLFQVFGRRR